MSGISPKSAQKIPEICPEHPRNLVHNVPEICLERLGDGQQVPKSPMESPSIWVSFLRVPKSLERGTTGTRVFLGGMSQQDTALKGEVSVSHISDN
jgi:hypothetical protein